MGGRAARPSESHHTTVFSAVCVCDRVPSFLFPVRICGRGDRRVARDAGWAK